MTTSPSEKPLYSYIITFAGAIHCIVMHVPRVRPDIFRDGFEDD